MTTIDFKTISISGLAGLVYTKFTEHQMKTVLVGGACVAIYSENRYLSYDLDFVTYETRGKIKKALLELGFELKGKYFSRPDCPYFIEFVTPPIAVGEELVHRFKTLYTPFGQVELLTPIDCIKDRLASFFHWDDRQALEQAAMVFQNQKVDLQEIERWAKAENYLEKFKDFKKIVTRLVKRASLSRSARGKRKSIPWREVAKENIKKEMAHRLAKILNMNYRMFL